MRSTSPFRFIALIFLIPLMLHAQGDKALLRELAEDNKKSVEALALYPSDIRLAILEAAQYPEVLIKMNDARQKTAGAFRALIEDEPRPAQEMIYEVVRYPGLLSRIVENQDSPTAVREALQQIPEEQREAAYDLTRQYMPTLSKIDALDRTSRMAFEDLISPYPANAQNAFRRLVDLPEVLDILNEDLRFTILVGDVYRSDPAWVIQKTDSLNLAVARSHAEEQKAWKAEIENDPQAQSELEAASKEYAAEFGYDTEDYPGDDLYADGIEYRPAYSVDYYYPWWFGYPWWYPYPCWRPYPWWYQWGFYHRHNHFVVMYIPSWHFVDWYFNHPHHHRRYNHLSAHFVDHYYGHRRSGTSISVRVGEWREQNRTVLSDEWLRDKTRLPERMKDYGRFEEERQAYNARHPKETLSSERFLEKNKRQYPELERSSVLAKAEVKRDREAQQKNPSDWAPRKEPAAPKTEPAQKPKTERPPRIQQSAPKDTPKRPDAQPVRPNTEREKTNSVDKAKDYHRQKWEETKRTETQRDRQPATTPQKQPPKAEKPKPDSRKKSGGNR
ncbi:MAG: hypothetical protein KDC70_03350 [Saprospiraceae bacterium]|nr:hypothetical protein [Saprospiraceae bacterium]